MVQQILNWPKGSRIYYETCNGNITRFVHYSKGQKNENAGKYYYLKILQKVLKIRLAKAKLSELYNDLIYVCDKTTSQYDQALKEELCRRFGRYIPNDEDIEVFFTIIYLAMVDMEAGKLNHPHWLGKRMVLNSCKAVLLNDVDYKDVAEMYQQHHIKEDSSSDVNYEDSDSYSQPSYEKYGGYNDYDDDTIDYGFDGHPEATWNVD